LPQHDRPGAEAAIARSTLAVIEAMRWHRTERIEEVPMAAANVVSIRAGRAALLAAAVLLAANAARAEPAASSASEARVVVTGDGSVSVAPDYAQIRSGVTTRAKTVKEAVDANSKLMAAVTAALRDAGIAEKDIQTSRFTIQPIYDRPDPRAEQRPTASPTR
jgi:uncharacterized protein YggE